MHRIVSLLPSATEIVCALGFADQLVGRSHECDYPSAVKSLPALTSPKFDPEGSSAAIDERPSSSDPCMAYVTTPPRVAEHTPIDRATHADAMQVTCSSEAARAAWALARERPREIVMTRSRKQTPVAVRAERRANDRWLAIARLTRPVCSAIAPRPLLGTVLAGTLLLVAEMVFEKLIPSNVAFVHT